MRRYIIGLILCATATTAAIAQTEVSAYQNGNADGITYYLPNPWTVVWVQYETQVPSSSTEV